MAFQFLHIDTVARAAPKKAAGKRWSVAEVLAEAERRPDACPHVENPKPPRRVLGVPLFMIENAVERNAKEARDAKGRRLRKDSPVMLAGVASYPVPMAELDKIKRGDFERWEERTLAWLRGRFGENLAAVVRHEDEAFPHLHFFVVPDLTPDRRIGLDAVHPGIAARDVAKGGGKGTKEANRAYCEAMRGLQNDFHERVGLFHGHLREGPKRRRLSRGAYNAEKRDAKRRAETMAKVEMELAELEQLRVIALGAKEAKRRAAILEGQNEARHRELVAIKKEADGLKRSLREMEKSYARAKRDAEIAQGAVFHLIGFIVKGAERCRQALLGMGRPNGVAPESWARLRQFLMPPHFGSGGEERTRRNSGLER